MKRIATLWLLLLTVSTTSMVWSDETVTVSSTSSEIAENLDLKAVATLFGEVQNLEEFERELNSEERHLNNLDLNGDGVVDYLRVVEIGDGDNRMIVLQAVLAKDIYQDVATVYVERQADKTVVVQVVGDEYIYGADYIIEPVYVYRPIIYDWFWGPYWTCWASPYYWGYYPPYWHYYAPWQPVIYCEHIHYYHYSHPRCSFHYARSMRSGASGLRNSERGRAMHRQDYAVAHPANSFASRHSSEGSSVTNLRSVSRLPRTESAISTRSVSGAAEGRSTAATMRPVSAAEGTPAGMRTTGRGTEGRNVESSRSTMASTTPTRTFGSTNIRISSTTATARSVSSTSATVGRANTSVSGATASSISGGTAATTTRPTAAATTSRPSSTSSAATATRSTASARSTFGVAGSSARPSGSAVTSSRPSGSSSAATATRSTASARSSFSAAGSATRPSSTSMTSSRPAGSMGGYSSGSMGGSRPSGSMGSSRPSGSMGGGRPSGGISTRR